MRTRLVPTWAATAVLIAGGCGGDDGATTTSTGLSPAALDHAGEIESVVLGYEDGWARGDFDLIASFLDEDEFVFNEPDAVDLDKDEFMGLMFPFIDNPAVDAADVHYFVGDDEVVSVARAWGFGGGTTEENPVVEVDVFTVRDGAITSIRSMYGAEFVYRYTGIEGAEELAAAYGSAWSSGDPAEVAALYADDAVRSEPLYGRRLEGAEEIGQAARERSVQRPAGSMVVVDPYVFASADTLARTFGAMYVVGDDSACKVLVLLEPNDAGEITRERVYFHTETLDSCDR